MSDLRIVRIEIPATIPAFEERPMAPLTEEEQEDLRKWKLTQAFIDGRLNWRPGLPLEKKDE
jgi:hypothetical protein